jgi:hypothetical protein
MKKLQNPKLKKISKSLKMNINLFKKRKSWKAVQLKIKTEILSQTKLIKSFLTFKKAPNQILW